MVAKKNQAGRAPEAALDIEHGASNSEPLLADVAAAAGVSTATVSRYLNDPHKVSAKTHARVRAAVEQLGWIPNAAARSLVSRRSNAVGVVVPTLMHEKFHQQVQAFQAEMGKHGFSVFVSCSGYDPSEGYRQARSLLSRGVDALALLGDDFPPELFSTLHQRQTPFVITFGAREGSEHPCVGFDQYAAYESLTRYLLSLGHTRIGLVFHTAVDNARTQARLKGVFDTLAREGLAVRPQHMQTMTTRDLVGRIPFARAAVRAMLAERPAPTAIMCGNDVLALGALLEAKAAGIDVPGQLSITGFDDNEIAAELSPALTTIRVPDLEIGALAAEYLLERIAGRSPTPPAMLDVLLIKRGSTGPAPQAL
ncbi:LacI family DNA-binding transcriptional regulator [Pararobbsia silviterrae]|uniref:LacI family DNA-binding transcriptional regulator n=1 Tax=Pararobbsia silviterrae TaxID=1792498 RepID=A0A494XRQ5_9BURK|nr:LacI family DNA-binding transcriptional regulator [Pararobbsia silviterrae]RKP53285.1 LacI family DNA-binding transcriptional regulator [Pararobbsia silviterrae]